MKKPLIAKKTGTIKGANKPKFKRPPKKGEMRPQFESLTEAQIENPFDDDPDLTVGLQGDSDEAISLALETVLNERSERRDMYRVINDEHYYFLVCFQSEQQKLEFLEKAGWKGLGDARFLDGLKLAELLGMDVEPINLPMKEYKKKMPVRLRGKEVIR